MKRSIVTLCLVSLVALNLTVLAPAPAAYSAPAAMQSAQVNVNTATVSELEAVRGIGPTLAQRIVDYRESISKFASVDELANVRGIGGSKLLRIKDQITAK